MASNTPQSTFYKNMQTLNKFYPFNKDLEFTFVKGMFKKPNWKGFVNVIHYLLTIIEPTKLQFSTILIDQKEKLNFRTSISKILKDLSVKYANLNLKRFEPSTFVNPGGKDIEDLVFKLSYLALYIHLRKDFSKDKSPDSIFEESNIVNFKILNNLIYNIYNNFIQKFNLETINFKKIKLLLNHLDEFNDKKQLEDKLLEICKETEPCHNINNESRKLYSQLMELIEEEQDLIHIYEKIQYFVKLLGNIKDKYPLYFVIFITEYIMHLLENTFNLYFAIKQQKDTEFIEEYVDNFFILEKEKENLNNITKESIFTSPLTESFEEIIKTNLSKEGMESFLKIYQENITPLRKKDFEFNEKNNENFVSYSSWSDVWNQFDNNLLNNTQDLKHDFSQEKNSTFASNSFTKSSSEENTSRVTSSTSISTATSNSKSEESDNNESIHSNQSQTSVRRQSLQNIIDRYNQFKAKKQIQT